MIATVRRTRNRIPPASCPEPDRIMEIRLTKDATWGGKRRRKDSVHDVPDHVAKKLVDRGFATTDIDVTKSEAETDGDRDGHGTPDVS